MPRAIVRALVVAILLLGFGTEAAIAGPVRLVKATHAASCCAGRCARFQAVACASGCCPSARADDAPTISPAPAAQTASVAAPVLATPLLGVVVAAIAPSAIVPHPALGPPLPPPLHAPLRL